MLKGILRVYRSVMFGMLFRDCLGCGNVILEPVTLFRSDGERFVKFVKWVCPCCGWGEAESSYGH